MVTAGPSVELLEWAVADRPFPGAATNGDGALCVNGGRRALVAAIDGLGHGAEAAAAAAVALHVLRSHSTEEPAALALRCHKELAATRGASISLALFEAPTRRMTWLAIGNVEGRLVRRDHGGRARSRSLLLPGGAAGRELPPLVPVALDVQIGDLLIFATDGIESDFAEAVDLTGSVTDISARILSAKTKPSDDALVLVARYVERGLP